MEPVHAVAEIEGAARAPTADLRLPVVQLVMDKVEAETQIMGPFDPVEVGHIGVYAIVAHHRAPVVDVAERAVAGDIEDREAALPDVGAIGPRYLEHVGADV